MSNTQKNAQDQDNLDQKLTVLKDLMKRENEMLRKMISSLDSLEKELIRSQKDKRRKIKRPEIQRKSRKN